MGVVTGSTSGRWLLGRDVRSSLASGRSLLGSLLGRSLPSIVLPFSSARTHTHASPSDGTNGSSARGAGVVAPPLDTLSLEFSHLPFRPGVQFVQILSLRTQTQPLQRPLPLHRQHCGGITVAHHLTSRRQRASHWGEHDE